MKIRAILTALVILVALAACNLPQAGPTPGADAVASLVAATLQELATPVLPTISSTLPNNPPPTTASTATMSPTFGMTVTMTSTPGTTETLPPGSIEGGISGYPYGSLPKLTVVAFDKSSPYLRYWYWKTGAGNTTYAMDGYVSPGS